MKEEIKEYINYIFIEKKLSDNTKDAYSNDLTELDCFLNHKCINKINSSDITSYINYLSNNNEKDKSLFTSSSLSIFGRVFLILGEDTFSQGFSLILPSLIKNLKKVLILTNLRAIVLSFSLLLDK